MKQIYLIILIVFCSLFTSYAQNNVGINDNNSSPNASAMLDVFSASKGLLIPRIALTSTTTASPVSSPVASLLIYNTATTGDVIPGYYYWNGSKWVRLMVTTDPDKNFNLFSKSANATLLKSENLILASGNIILTLPTVTSADDGLEITVKNTGTFTDLVKIIPQSGKKIDAIDTSTLTRWKGKTFIASSSNWIVKENEPHTDNYLEVSPSGSFTTIAEVIAFLNMHMTGPVVVQLGGGTYTISGTQNINLPYPLTFQGLSFGETFINAAAGVSGNALFNCSTECYFKMITFNAIANTSGNDALRFTGSGVYYEVKDAYFLGFNKAIVTSTNNDLWIFESDFENCTGAGIEIAAGTASGGSIKLSEADFIQCKRGVNLLSGISETVSILNCGFYNTASGTDTALVYSPLTFTSFSSMFISNNTWNNQGVFFYGFDFSRPDGRDANAFLTNNAGYENEIPHCKINVTNNTTTTTVTLANTYYKANWTNAATSYTCKWTLANNRITYQPNSGNDIWAIITGDLSVNVTSHIITIALVKNGVTTVRYGETDLRPSTANQPFQFSTVIYIPDIKKNDYLELFVTSSASGDLVKFQDLQWFTNTQ